MKRLLIGILSIIMLLLATGCTSGSGYTVLGYENNSANSMQMSYEKFSGTRTATVKVDEDHIIMVRVNLVTESGSISLWITDEDGNEIYQGIELTDSTMFTVNLKEAGTYKIKVEGKDHNGSYRINWAE